ncbi:Helix-turn-helix protein [Streptomyces sp. YIM 130001]|uniref:helix-turn-helix domain-containing protein n=1 Tax=Streptomyces sp. YIM 130001 TaxID=2259644 RepID=UPI000E64E58D|nr:helix-turn-helix transcriptional regulator [Streptomyces sp. YIM 130001]RII09147.1 Helix-turn-helix protein [Streptomyces sp. YIM 130001]
MARAQNKHTAGSATRYVAGMARKLREKQGLSQRELGERTGFTAAAISAMETCAQPASDQMLIALEAALGGGLGLFEDAREFVRLEKYPVQFKNFVPLEQAALTMSSYETFVINGLFQTERYARALIGGGYPPLEEERVEELVEARLARRALFDRVPVALVELVVEEAVLRRPFGSREIMREQLLYLTELGERRNVTLQVLPLERGIRGDHAGARGGMTLIETPSHDHLLYMEIQDESLLISEPEKVSSRAQQYAKIRAQALDPDQSLTLIERLAGEEQ